MNFVARRSGADLRAILVVAAASASSLSFGQERTPAAVLGDGNVPCSSWTEARKGTDYASIKALSTMTGWVEGYVTAASLGADVAGAKFPSMSADAVVSWIDGYCSRRPSDSLAQASAAFAQHLAAK